MVSSTSVDLYGSALTAAAFNSYAASASYAASTAAYHSPYNLPFAAAAAGGMYSAAGSMAAAQLNINGN